MLKTTFFACLLILSAPSALAYPGCQAVDANIPLVAQDLDFACGIACTRSVLQSLGLPDPGELNAAWESGTFLHGSTPPESIVSFFHRRQLYAAQDFGRDLDDLRCLLQAGEKTIVSVYFQQTPHYAVLKAIGNGRVVLMDPWVARKGIYRDLPESEFLREWSFFHGHVIRVSLNPIFPLTR